MARRKKKQKQSAARPTQKTAAAPSPQDAGPALAHGTQAPALHNIELAKVPQKQPPITVEPAKSIAKAKPAASRGVAVSTCIAGMFLSLVLGLYLGTLMPGVIQDLQPEQKKAAQAPRASAGQTREDPELAHMVAELEQKAAANPDSAPDWINLGNIYFDAMQPAKAVTAYERALQLAPKNADVLTDLGIMYRETGQFEKAVEAFNKALEVNPQHENAMFNEGVVLGMDLGRKDEAAAVWKRLLERNPAAHAPNGKPLAKMIEDLR